MRSRRLSKITQILILALIIGITPMGKTASAATDAWNGNADTSWFNSGQSSFTIDTAEKMAGVAELVYSGTTDFTGKTLTLTSDLDLSNYQWRPIGTSLNYFNGSFDGDHHTISGLTIGSATAPSLIDDIGLFGIINDNAYINNTEIVGAYVYAGSNINAGGLVGSNTGSGRMENCSVAGTVAGGEQSCVGGLLGMGYDNTGSVSNCHSAGEVIGYSQVAIVGGLIGSNFNIITNCYSNCTVEGDTSVTAGGLIGFTSSGTVSNCYATGNVTGRNSDVYYSYVGGLTGYNQSTILNCFATGNVTGGGSSSVNAAYTGGFVGYNIGSIEKSYTTGNVIGGASGGRKSLIGGFVGKNYNRISNCYAIGNVTGGAGATLGGFAGGNNTGLPTGKLYDTFWNNEAVHTVDANILTTDKLGNGEGTPGSDTCGLTEAVMKGAAPDSTIIYIDSSGLAKEISTVTSFLAALNSGSTIFQTDSRNVNHGYPFIIIEATDITVAGSGGAASVACGGTLSMIARLTPITANSNLIWSLVGGSGTAAIDAATGLLTANAPGNVTVKAEVYNIPAVFATTDIQITSISVTGVSLDQSNLYLTAGGATGQLIATVSPADATNQNIVWTSSDEAVVTVADGIVTPVAKGNAAITVTTQDGNFSANCAVTVTNTQTLVTGVNLDKSTLNLTVGGATGQLTATVSPADATNKNIVWTSSNEAVITVADGIVTPVAKGNAAITVTTQDGNFSANCAVTVTNTQTSVTGVNLDKSTLNLTVGGAVGQLIATIIPAGATNQSVVWTSSNDAVATVAAGIVTPIAPGNTTITVTTQDGGFSATCTVTVIASAPGNGGSSRGDGGSSGGNGSRPANSTTISVKPDVIVGTIIAEIASNANGIVQASVTDKQISDVIDRTRQNTAQPGSKTVIEISVPADENVPIVETTIPQAAWEKLVNSSAEVLTISSPQVSITLDKIALAVINSGSNGDIVVKAALLNQTALADEEAVRIGNRPVYDLTVTAGSTEINDLGGGTAFISIPYTLAPNEEPSQIVIYYLADHGQLVMVPNCVYDSATGMATFTTRHLSIYAVGYNKVIFSDVTGWCKDYVNYLAAREIISGMGDSIFSPNANITRAQLVSILAKLSGANLSKYTATSFTDVAPTDWYFPAVQWAYENGIAVGANGMFSPDDNITRQDMAVMIAHYAEAEDYTLSIKNQAQSFTDSQNIAFYAADSVKVMQQADIINGNSDGSFAPTDQATRAQAAKIIALLLQGTINYIP